MIIYFNCILILSIRSWYYQLDVYNYHYAIKYVYKKFHDYVFQGYFLRSDTSQLDHDNYQLNFIIIINAIKYVYN